MANQLIVHKPGSERVSYADLTNIPAPQSQGPRHYPVAHRELIDVTRNELAKIGFEPQGEQFAVANHGLKLFATMNLLAGDNAPALIPESERGVRGLAFGLRHGNDRSLAIEMVCGARIFVCDNMAFSGDAVILHRMHTKHVRLQDEVGRGIQRLLERYETFEHNIARLQDTPLNDRDAKERIYDAFMRNAVLATKYIKEVDRWYFDAEDGVVELGENKIAAPDCQPRTLWGLHNAFTRAIKEIESPTVQFQGTMRVGRFLGLRSDVVAESRRIEEPVTA